MYEGFSCRETIHVSGATALKKIVSKVMLPIWG